VWLTLALADGANKKIIEEMKKTFFVGLDGFGEIGYDDLTWCAKPFSGVELQLVDLR